jgi:hypothetical protein
VNGGLGPADETSAGDRSVRARSSVEKRNRSRDEEGKGGRTVQIQRREYTSKEKEGGIIKSQDENRGSGVDVSRRDEVRTRMIPSDQTSFATEE